MRAVLLAVAVLPLVGAGWYASRELDRAASSRARAEVVASSLDQLVGLTNLRAAVLDERNWSLVSGGLADIGVGPSVLQQFTGYDLLIESATAQSTVDQLLDEIEADDIGVQLTGIRRAGLRTVERTDGYDAIEATLAERSDRVITDLLATAGNVDNGADLVATLGTLEHAISARQAVTTEVTTFFAAQFASSADGTQHVESLASQRAIYDDAIGHVAQSAPAGSSTAVALERIRASADVFAFQAAIDDLIGSTFQSGLTDKESTLIQLFNDLDNITTLFRSGNASSTAHLDLVISAADDTVHAAERATASSEASTRRALMTIGALAIATLLSAYVLTRAIVTPLRELAAQARQLRDGGDVRSTTIRRRHYGPREVRESATAISEAAAHLALAERQATALAHGDLTHPVLGESAPGTLGASLQRAVGTLAASMNDREEFQRRLAHEASHDGLTSLPNRRASLGHLQQGLARTRRNDAALAVLFVDLDGFKEVNDNHGHIAGDTVLRACAQRLATVVREGDHVGRLGGDEFLIIAEPVSNVDEAIAIATDVRAALCEPILFGSNTVHVDACIGIAITTCRGDLTADELLRDADLAVYQAKSLGRGHVELCNDELKAEFQHQVEIERDLRHAIDNDELTLYYQPVVDSLRKSVISYEALVRWQRPGFGLVMPGDFIEIAERSDLIVELDNWVLDRAVRQLDEWTAHPGFATQPVAVNLSGRHLGRDDLVDDVLDALARHGVDPERLILEVTETGLLSDLSGAAAKLQALQAKGVKIAIDDFGTGYTSLAYLRALPVDVLKIDRSFTIDMAATSLIELIINTGHLLGARITAEGIETTDQSDRLQQMGCDAIQGYLYGRPCAPDQLPAALPSVVPSV